MPLGVFKYYDPEEEKLCLFFYIILPPLYKTDAKRINKEHIYDE